MIRALAGALLALALAACASVPPAPAGEGRFVEWERLEAEGLPDQRVTIWLPPEYDSARGKRFPVLYMHDGQNLFDPAKTHYGKAWQVDDVLRAMVAAGEAEPHIVVGVWSPDKDRYRQYLPQPAEAATGAIAESMRQMAGGPIVSARYLEWLADTLKPRIDREYRTRPAAEDTTVIGSSMGGIMSCYAMVERPDTFGRAACVSSHWPIADPELAAAQKGEIDAIWRRWLDAKLGPPNGRRVWMDHGTALLDAHYAPYQASISEGFRANGWREGEHFVARSYEGAEHDEIAWNARLPEMLAWLWAAD